jgi:hypothetical protein
MNTTWSLTIEGLVAFPSNDNLLSARGKYTSIDVPLTDRFVIRTLPPDCLATPSTGDAMLGDHEVGLGTRRCDDPVDQLGDDARTGAFAIGRLQRDDRTSLRGAVGGAYKPTFPGFPGCWAGFSASSKCVATKFDRNRLCSQPSRRVARLSALNSLLCLH